MDQTVVCEACKQKVTPGVTFWNGSRLVFKCPECGAANSQSGRFEDLIMEVE